MKTASLEFAMLVRGGRAIWIALAFAIVVLLSGTASWVTKYVADTDKANVARAERERWLNQTEKDPHQAAHYSVYAFKPSMPLQTLDPGIQPFVGQAIWLEPHWQNDMVYRPLQEAEPFQRMGLAHPAKFLIEFAPLFVFLVAFVATAADREKGPMRLALGTARSPQTYVWGKWSAVTFLCAVALLVPAVVIGLGSTLGEPNVDNFARLGVWTVSFVIYIAILTAIGIAVCLNAPTARLGFAALLGIWVVLAFLAPRAASSNANSITALPSFQVVKLEMEKEAPIYWGNEAQERQTQMLMEKYGVRHEDELPVDLRAALIDYNERHSHEVFDKHLGAFYNQVEAQDRTYAAQSWLSPAVALYAVSSAMAGANFAHHRDFIDSAERYRRTLVNRMNEELMKGATKKGGTYLKGDFVASADTYNEIPEFKYMHPRIGLALQSAGVASAAMGVWLLLGLALLAWTARVVRP